MSLHPQLIALGDRPRSSKRGAHGPAPARRCRLWDGAAARKGTLEVRSAVTNELLSSKLAPQEQLCRYAGLRMVQLLEAAQKRGIDPLTARGRRWLARASSGAHERWVLASTQA